MQWGEKLINSRHTIRGTDGHGEVNHSDNSMLHIRKEQGKVQMIRDNLNFIYLSLLVTLQILVV